MFSRRERQRGWRILANRDSRQQHDEKQNQMRLSDKFYKTSQHWLAAEIFIKSRIGARVDKYY